MNAHWLAIARHTPLAILTDLDGTLIPFAPTPEEAQIDDELRALLASVAELPGVRVIVVSGRPHEGLERYFPEPSIWLVAEHGAWCRGEGAWQSTIDLDASPIAELAAKLDALGGSHPGARVERKTWSCALHYRQIPTRDRAAFEVEASVVIDAFLSAHSSFERVDGDHVIEVRAAAARKSFAVTWSRRQVGADARIVAIGDDLTDEHLFAALDPVDEGVLVRGGIPRRSHARWEIDGVPEVRKLLAYVRDVRLGRAPDDVPLSPLRPSALPPPPRASLLVMSNRLPDLRASDGDRKVKVGGLVSALQPMLAQRNGLWLGWGGRVVADDEEPGSGITGGTPALAWFDYKQSWLKRFYNGFCNATLWPLLHSFPNRVVIDGELWKCYVHVNEFFAAAARQHAGPDDTVWVHDYHLLLAARALRESGHRGRIGLFLHVPFPPADIFAMLPWARDIVDAMLEFDLLGFHTHGYVANFVSCANTLLGTRASPTLIEHRGRFTSVGAFPIGIVPDSFQDPDPALVAEVDELVRAIGPNKLVLGVDRLDYTKGIPERLLAFGKLLELEPSWRGKVSLVQISVPSREDVPEYVEQRAAIEGIVGRINGEFGEVDWVPIRYLYRGYGQDHLARFYRAAHVGYVTPLRDGMNLVAKEYVAAQDAEDPGVLLLSQFAGAAEEMTDAVITNPYYVEGLARDLDRSLRMALAERKARHARLLAVVERTTAITWASAFLDALSATEPSDEKKEVA